LTAFSLEAGTLLHTSALEGINNRIKVIKRMAYGYRDEAYFFLKIRAAFPGKLR
jgi:transposase